MIDLTRLRIPEEVRDALLSLKNDFSINNYSSKGSNGHLFFAYDKGLKRDVAIKFYCYDGDPTQHLEPQQLAEMNSPQIIKVYHAAKAGNEWAYFITPFCPKGDLDDLISNTNFSTHEAIELVLQILSGMVSLHTNNLLHRDLKPQNILISDKLQPLIGDFGSVRRISPGNDSVIASGHALLYRPPESVKTNTYSTAGDIYQAGIMLYQLLGGHLPYDERAWLNPKQLEQLKNIHNLVDRTIFCDDVLKARIMKGNILDLNSLPQYTSKGILRILRKACHTTPENRFDTAGEFHASLASLKSQVLNWTSDASADSTSIKSTGYRLVHGKANLVHVEQNKGTGWRRADAKFPPTSYREQVTRLEALNRSK